MGIKLVGLIALSLSVCMATKCPAPLTNTRSSESNSNSAAHRECNPEPLFGCYDNGTTTPAASTPDASSAATDTASPSDVTQAASTYSVSNSSSASCQCVLVVELRKIKFKALKNLNHQILFEAVIKEIEEDCLDITITVTFKLKKYAKKLKKFFLDYPDIECIIEREKIAAWGRLFELIHAGFSLNDEGQKAAIAPVDNTGACALTAAIESATANDTCGNGTSLIASTTTKFIKRICFKNDDDWPVERKIAIIIILLKQLCANNASSNLSQAVLNAQIPGFGTVQDYLTFGDMYQTFSSIGIEFLSGSAESNCLIQSLNSSINSNDTAQTYNSSVIAEGNNYIANLVSYFKIQFDPVRRLKFCSAQFSFLSSLAHEMCYKALIISPNFKSYFSQVIAASHFCTNNNVTFYNQTVQQDYPHCCKIDKNNNTELVQALDYDLKPKLISAQYNSFTSCKNSIVNCIYKLNPTDHVAAWSCCNYYIKNNCFYGNTQPRGLMLKTSLWTVYSVVSNVVQLGNIAGFCGCN